MAEQMTPPQMTFKTKNLPSGNQNMYIQLYHEEIGEMITLSCYSSGTAKLAESLKKNYSEIKVFEGIQTPLDPEFAAKRDQILVEAFANPETGTFTTTNAYASGWHCTINSGEHFGLSEEFDHGLAPKKTCTEEKCVAH